MKEIGWTCVRQVVKRCIGFEPNKGMIADDLSGSLEGVLARDGNDATSHCCRRQNKTIDGSFHWCAEKSTTFENSVILSCQGKSQVASLFPTLRNLWSFDHSELVSVSGKEFSLVIAACALQPLHAGWLISSSLRLPCYPSPQYRTTTWELGCTPRRLCYRSA